MYRWWLLQRVGNYCLNHSTNINFCSFHIGSLSDNPSAYVAALAACATLFHYGTEVGYQFTLLDIGGGFPGEKGSDNMYAQLVAAIKRGLSQHFSPAIYPHLKVIAEPGKHSSILTIHT